jgi:hypothetical protein
VQRLLDKQGALVRPSTGKAYTRTERLPAEGKQNVYRINAKVFGLMAESEADD